ncbi:MAG: dihydrodipicolinate reductase [Desulfobacter sp.]|nr:MAG: dihydrodipicolinate reductase [Desulfobacter sp.]
MTPIPIMINGLPGNVARIIAAGALSDQRFDLVPFSLTGADVQPASVTVGQVEINLVKPDTRNDKIKEILAAYPGLVAVDYTHPTAVNANAEFYTANGIPFVMGTTGGDREKLEATVNQAGTPAVISPNMAKQIVGFQAMMEYAAKTFPGLFSGYTLEVKESHQQGKADTSGTAKAIVSCFNGLGVDFKVSDIQQIRDPEVQEKEWGIPKEHLGGHGWHTYTLRAGDGSSLFEFTHNINGRDIYIGGTLDAVAFLSRLPKGETKRLFTMIDVMTREKQMP